MTSARRPFWRVLFAVAIFDATHVHAELIPLYDGPGGVTCAYYNVAGRVRWQHRKGDWRDATGVAQGAVPFALDRIEPADQARVVVWDVTALARIWFGNASANTGLLLAGIPGGPKADIFFHSREADDPLMRPRLVLEFTDGTRQELSSDADAHLDCSTVQALGQKKVLHAGSSTSVVMRFVRNSDRPAEDIQRATLLLTTATRQRVTAALGAYLLDPPVKAAPGRPLLGIAERYPRDHGIDKDADVLMATGFDSMLWLADWSYVRPELTFWPVSSDAEHGFQPLDGHALRVKIPRGSNLGLDLGYDFMTQTGSEPEEIYFRYYLRFANDWMPVVDGGKLPGISGTYGRAGWGGRKSDGHNGWSMRGQFARMPEVGNPLHEYVTVGTYAYHAATEDVWGDEWIWDVGLRGLLMRNRWYCIEQYLRLNHVGSSDAELKAWIDGELAFDRTGFRVRDIPELKIEKIWMNVYHGGTAPAVADMHLYIDNVVIARRYIGPMQHQ